MNSRVLSLLLAIWVVLGCQRDDICPESTDTTPQLIIRFFENEEPFPDLAPQNLNVRAVGVDSLLYSRINLDSIALPLRTDSNTTSYILTLNAPTEDGEENPDFPTQIDTLTFTYGREQIYINRACAFKIIYPGLGAEVQDEGTDNWIQAIEIEENIVEDENQAHVSIFF